MRHLTLEALARLVDEAPDAHEGAHLAACSACRDELDALREQTETLRALPDLMPAPDAWPALESRLREEGVVKGRAAGPARRMTVLTRIAAALVLFVAGGASGFMARGLTDGPAADGVPVADGGSVAGDATGPAVASAQRRATGDATADGAPVAPGAPSDADPFAAALDQYMAGTELDVPDPAARLAALDNIVLTTAEALRESPGDPVINSYHLTAVAERDRLLRQLSIPVGEPVF